jgi:hypothetical protein
MKFTFLLSALILLVSQSSFAHDDYSNKWSADKKLNYLWDQIENTNYQREIPSYEKTNISALLKNLLANDKKDNDSDIIGEKYTKGIHRRASVAKVKFRSALDNQRLDLWGGFDYALLRISLTEIPNENIYKPGLALKVLIDGQASANLSMLVDLDGFASSNIFEKTYSNIVPKPLTVKGKLGVALFRLRSKYPRAIKVDRFCSINQSGQKVNYDKITQLYFKPNDTLKKAHFNYSDPRLYLNNDLEQEQVLFGVYAGCNTNYSYNTFSGCAKYLGDIILDSNFMSSSFGDERLFFNHEFVD